MTTLAIDRISEPEVDALRELAPRGGTFLDLCTGSGCIAVSALVHRKDLTAVGVDISSDALKMAEENAALSGVSERISFRQADVLAGGGCEGTFDVIVSNPPYIRTDVIPTLDTVTHEPRLALDGGEDGLNFYRAILRHALPHLKDGGWLLLEIGYDQADDLRALLPGCEVRRDYGGNDRVVLWKR